MVVGIALCDGHGYINRVLCSTPLTLMVEGIQVQSLFAEPEPVQRLLNVCAGTAASARLKLCAGGPEDPVRTVEAAARTYDAQILFLLYGIDGEEELPELTGMLFSLVEELELLQGQLHESSYYEIQKVNNQLINSQRDLAKANERLKELLEETRRTKNTLEILERDPLTNLYNKKAFYERAEVMLREKPNVEFDIIVVDIERFKLVNDMFGAQEGDKMLVRLTNCLLNIRVKDLSLLARANADQFYILIPVKSVNYEHLAQMLREFEEGYPLPMQIQVKFGIYRVLDRDLELSKMCDRAALAADKVKGIFDRSFAFYDDSIRKELLREQQIVNTMSAALEREEFQVYLQPKVELVNGRLIGAEALVRWEHPEFGVMPPGQFIPVFEKNGFISPMDFCIWEKTCRIMEEWKQRGKELIPVSVNVSRLDLYNANLPEIFAGMVERHGLKPADLHLEITESVYVSDSRQIIAVVQRLKDKGFIIEMDDFGTGYSSLNILSELKLDALKMDLGFLRPGENVSIRKTIMQFVIRLAERLHLQVIAEGVETEEQAELLREMGCRFAQGYLFGRPMPCETFGRHYGFLEDDAEVRPPSSLSNIQ